ncbi:MAG: TonB-dependent receptor plug domain-containing protein [Gammaproteobacteria bacterium]|nr:TonB-dependent receptor plug domain-containing protein [Gammaproteobacteria bacterium]
MHKHFNKWVSLVAVACLFWSSAAFGQQAADDADEEEDEEAEDVEELIVTGSFIRRDNFDLPSPMHVTDELDIELAGTPDMGDIIFDQTFQFGVNANAAPFEGDAADDQQWNQGSEVWANIRGLGARATMTMMDSHRLPADTNTWGRRTGVDVTNTYPQIAIGRVETILDGASALYGAEAVAGVINIIPNKDFDGLRINYNNLMALRGGAPNQGISMIAGAQGERTKAVFSLELRDVGQMAHTQRPEYIVGLENPWNRRIAPGWSDSGSRSNPSDWRVPQRNSLGERNFNPPPADPLYGAGNRLADSMGSLGDDWRQLDSGEWSNLFPDPGCGYGFGAGYDDNGTVGERVVLDGADVEVIDSRTGERVPQNWSWVKNDYDKQGSFLNGIVTPWGGTGNCRNIISDAQDMQAETDQYKGYAFFEHEFNDYVSIHGEIGLTVLDYYTRDVTGAFDETPSGVWFGRRVPVAIGSNPGNPFRAVAQNTWYDPATGASYGSGASIPAEARAHPAFTTDLKGLSWVDLNGNGVYDYLEEPGELYVFAQDENGDGIPDRTWDMSDETSLDGSVDENGDPLPDGIPDADHNAQRMPEARVILLSTETDSDQDGIPDRFDGDFAEMGSGGIRLFEDVRMPDGDLNVHPKQIHGLNIEWVDLDEQGTGWYQRRAQRDNIRFRLGTEVQIPDTTWIVNSDYVYARGKRERQYPEPQWWLMVDSLRCQGGGDDQNLQACWNPFSTSYLAHTPDGQFTGDPTNKFPDNDDPGWTPADHPATNTEFENRNAGIHIEYNLQTLGMDLFDLTASNSNLFSLPYNDAPVGFAIGTHWREETEEYRSSVINQSALGGGKRGFRVSGQRSSAFYAELQLPLIQDDVLGDMEVQIAGRYAEIYTYGVIGQPGSVTFTTTIPKVAMRYSPTDWLAVRASLTEGFVTPGLYALFGEPGQYGGQRAIGTPAPATVGDYLCYNFPELGTGDDPTCQLEGMSVTAPNVNTFAGPNSDLGAEFSDLWNAGFSFKLLDGQMVIDVDYTNVVFSGKSEQATAERNVNVNEIGLEEWYRSRACPGPGTPLKWFDPTNVTPEEHPWLFEDDPSRPGAQRLISPRTYVELYPEEASCKVQAAIDWVHTGAKGGQGEQGKGIGNARVIRNRGATGLGLTDVDRPWLQLGEQTTETVIYAMRYSFDAEDIPFIGGDYGSFGLNMSATQLLSMRNELYQKEPDIPDDLQHPLAGVEIEGVGNHNQGGGSFTIGGYNDGGSAAMMETLAPAPEFRVNLGLRWFYNDHILQFSGRWHDSVTTVNAGWDEAVEAGVISGRANPDEGLGPIPEKDACAHRWIWPQCKIDSRHYWDMSYTYRRPDTLGFSEMQVNVAVRNLFDTYPDLALRQQGHEAYLDNIMGRQGYTSVTFSF